MSGESKRVAMIGVDAADIDYIIENQNDLPHLRAALTQGELLHLSSDFEIFPGSVWPSFFTGKDTAEHGFYNIMAWDPTAMRLRRVTPDWLPMRPFWRDLSRQGLRVITIDVPMTYPPREGSSIEITGWGTHQTLSRCSIYPASLAFEVISRFGKDSLGSDVPLARDRQERIRVRDRLIASVVRKSRLAQWLMSTREWDFFLLVFGEAHRGGHILWPSGEERDPSWLLEVYRELDRALGRLLASDPLRYATVMVFALHGMGPNYSQDHFTPLILRRLSNDRRIREAPRFSSSLGNLLSIFRKGVPPQLRGFISRSLPSRVRDELVSRYYLRDYDRSVTQALALKSDLNGYIRFNIAGRESGGVLPKEGQALSDYAEYLREGFSSYVDESGCRLVKKVVWTKDVVFGERQMFLPDLVVQWDEEAKPASRIYSPIYGQITREPDPWRVGHHRGRGFCAVLRANRGKVGSSRSVLRVSALSSMVLEEFGGSQIAQIGSRM